MNDSKFSFVQKIRNKIRIDKNTIIEIYENVKVVRSSIIIKGVNNKLIIHKNTKIFASNLEIIVP